MYLSVWQFDRYTGLYFRYLDSLQLFYWQLMFILGKFTHGSILKIHFLWVYGQKWWLFLLQQTAKSNFKINESKKRGKSVRYPKKTLIVNKLKLLQQRFPSGDSICWFWLIHGFLLFRKVLVMLVEAWIVQHFCFNGYWIVLLSEVLIIANVLIQRQKNQTLVGFI